MSPSGKGGTPTNTPSSSMQCDLGHTDPPPPPVEHTISATMPLRMWLGLLGAFLTVSSLTFILQPATQVEALVAQAATEHARGHSLGTLLPWCGRSPSRGDVEAQVAAHLVRSLGSTYGTLGALTLTVAAAPLAQQLVATTVLTLWSVASMLAQPTFLSEEEARRRTTFHMLITGVNVLCVAWALLWREGHEAYRHATDKRDNGRPQ